MISTVTTSTVSTIATAAIAGSVILIGILLLLVLLIQKELVNGASGLSLKTFSRVLNIGIVPLLMAFLVVVVVRVVQIIR